ncbi:hypothetical protein M422DRAFT_261415 [Sphaerobolus stellatus SS14]|uniref:DUF6534 domain-containing protein n=1 Tax=Sphaerobolus stellatus (strain SS14) TaxID=990650 RepID=A0A0C9VFT6_SPHS4|nr:hypothetical protein M422DRAFT_261415 [Sphaerobolus stellatus SS14]
MPTVGETVTITIPEIPKLLGPLLVGLTLNWALLGILFIQVYIYYLCFPKDSNYVKILVYSLFCLEITQSVILMRDSWDWFITSWADPVGVNKFGAAWFNLPIMNGVIACAVQLSFAWRIWVLGRSWPLVTVIGIMKLAVVQMAAGVATGIMAEPLVFWSKIGGLATIDAVWISTSVAVDFIVAISMTYLLLKRRTNFDQSRLLISRLIRLTIETGSATAIIALVETVLYNTTKGTALGNLHSCPSIVLAKTYTNTLLVVLNNRIYMQRDTVAERLARNGSVVNSADRDSSRSRFTEVLVQRDGVIRAENNPTLTISKGEVYEDIAIDRLSTTKNIGEQGDLELGRPSGPINIRIDREATTREM